MHETDLDPRALDWLRDGPAGASDWVLESAVHHARRHPRRRFLRARWDEAMKAMTLGHPAMPALRLILVAGLTTLAVAAGGLFYAGSQGLFVGPTPTPSVPASSGPSATPTATPSAAMTRSREDVVDELHGAWRDGRVDATEELYAADHTLVVLDPTSERGWSSTHFEVRPGSRGWVYWEPRGRVVEAGDYLAEPMVAGVWDPGSHGLVVFRFDQQDRIEVEWALVRPTTWASSAEEVRAGPATIQLTTFVDRCVGALGTGDTEAYLGCYAANGESRVSADGAHGAWTEEAVGLDAIAAGLDGSTYRGIVRTGDMVEIGDIVTYPFRSSASDACSAGVDVFELDPGRTRILGHWVFCGPASPSASPTLAPTPEPSASGPRPDVVIDDMLEAWRDDDVAAVPMLFTSDHALHVIGDTSGLADGARHFEIGPYDHGGWVSWEHKGFDFHEGAYWAHATAAGVFETRRGFAVYRFAADARIEVMWVLLHRGGTPPASGLELTSFLDGCLEALRTGDAGSYLGCFRPDGSSRISADGTGGRWTEEHAGRDAIEAGLEGSAYTGVVRTGEVVTIGTMAAYPFRGASAGCRAGIDVFEFDPELPLVINHWALCGPE